MLDASDRQLTARCQPCLSGTDDDRAGVLYGISRGGSTMGAILPAALLGDEWVASTLRRPWAAPVPGAGLGP